MSDEQAKTFNIKVTLPDEWTLRHWQTYGTAQQEYIRKCREKSLIADSGSSKYFGAKALVDEGFVHFDGDEAAVTQCKAWLSSDAPPLKWVGWLNRAVGDVIEEAFFVPLA